MFSLLTPPTEKTLILRRILIILAALTLLQGLFLMFTYQLKTATYIISFIVYLFSICRLSYFGCILNQFISISLIWFLLLQMAIKLKIGLYEVYLSSQGIYKMSSLIFGIICLYFNFIAYKDFKQIAYQIYQQENLSEGEEEGRNNSNRNRDHRDRQRERERQRQRQREYE